MKTFPEGYTCKYGLKETQRQIKFIKDLFQVKLSQKLNLTRVSAPLFVSVASGLNDNLSGTEKAVAFDIPLLNVDCEIVHSLAKWKRWALKKYGFKEGEGIYTDMNAIRRQESVLDNLHSVYVDQWDWEKAISKQERTTQYLYDIVRNIYRVFYEVHTTAAIEFDYPQFLPQEIYFISSSELEKRFPNQSPKEREESICKERGAVFITQIGKKLSNGKPHDDRAADYDDWELNGDILIWYPLLECPVELSSMGIRVDAQSIKKQLDSRGVSESDYSAYHQAVMKNNLPLSIGGGIGQSRVCMVCLHKAHIGEVQCSLWDENMLCECEKAGIRIL